MARKAGKEAAAASPPPEETTTPPVAAAPAPAAPKQLTDDEYREALFRRLLAQHQDHDAELEKIRSAAKARNKHRTQVRDQLRQAGFLLVNIDSVLEAAGKVRSDEQSKVDQLHWMRDIVGLPNPKSGEQLDLLDRLPQTEKDGIAWEEDGYHKGVIGEPCDLPAACPPIFHQRWMNLWHRGKDRRDWALAAETNVERVAPADDAILRPVEHCAGCGGDGSLLAPDVDACPECGAEYELDETGEGRAPVAADDPGAAFDGEAEAAEPELVH